MKPGQRLTRWWQLLVGGRLTTPSALVAASRAEDVDGATATDAFFERQVSGVSWDAPDRLKAPGFMRTNGFLRQWERADWQYVDPRLMTWAAMVVEVARRRGIPLYVHSAFRTRDEQERAYADKRSKLRWPRGAHCIGEAVDIVHGVLHWNMTPDEWALIHALGERCLDKFNAGRPKAERLNLTWGGNWRFYDPAHWEISDFQARTRQITAGPPIRRTPRNILRMKL